MLRTNKREIHAFIIQEEKKPINSSLYVFQTQCTIVLYVPKKNKLILSLLLIHSSDDVDPSEEKKPEIILFYKLTKRVAHELYTTY